MIKENMKLMLNKSVTLQRFYDLNTHGQTLHFSDEIVAEVREVMEYTAFCGDLKHMLRALQSAASNIPDIAVVYIAPPETLHPYILSWCKKYVAEEQRLHRVHKAPVQIEIALNFFALEFVNRVIHKILFECEETRIL